MGEDHNGIGVGRKNCRRHRWEQGHRARNGALVTNPPFLSSCTGPAKSAEIRLSRILANEFALQNIRVNCVVPGFVNTPERFAKWERELAKRQLPDDAGFARHIYDAPAASLQHHRNDALADVGQRS